MNTLIVLIHEGVHIHYIGKKIVLHSVTRIKNIKNVTRCRDSRSAKSIETR